MAYSPPATAASSRLLTVLVPALMGAALPLGRKPFVDDGNSFVRLAGIPALTHGPAATGAHTLNEEVSVAELVRVARVYASTAVSYCAVSQ